MVVPDEMIKGLSPNVVIFIGCRKENFVMVGVMVRNLIQKPLQIVATVEVVVEMMGYVLGELERMEIGMVTSVIEPVEITKISSAIRNIMKSAVTLLKVFSESCVECPMARFLCSWVSKFK